MRLGTEMPMDIERDTMSVIIIDEKQLNDLIMATLIKHKERIGDYWNWIYAIAEADFVDVADDVCEAAKAAEKGVKDDQ